MLTVKQNATKENATFAVELLRRNLMENGFVQSAVSGTTNCLKGDNND